jgi:hypothetical protein
MRANTTNETNTKKNFIHDFKIICDSIYIIICISFMSIVIRESNNIEKRIRPKQNCALDTMKNQKSADKLRKQCGTSHDVPFIDEQI